MYTKLDEKVYKCNTCSTVRKTEAGIKKHVYDKHGSYKQKEEMAKKYEEIRTTSKSIHEVVLRLKDVWAEYGIIVNFDSYPDRWGYNISNTHCAPDGYEQNWGSKPGLPTGYPGWSGNWTGQVVSTDDRWGNIGFSDLLGKWNHKGLAQVPWIKTGSGGGRGNNGFSYSGTLFIYDFPAMHEQFKANGEEFKVLEYQYNEAVKDYRQRFYNERSNYIMTSTRYKNADEIKRLARELLKDVEASVNEVSIFLHNEFSEKYTESLPLPTSPFVADAVVSEVVVNQKTAGKPPPPLEDAYKYIEKLSKQYSKYMAENPEVFV